MARDKYDAHSRRGSSSDSSDPGYFKGARDRLGVVHAGVRHKADDPERPAQPGEHSSKKEGEKKCGNESRGGETKYAAPDINNYDGT